MANHPQPTKHFSTPNGPLKPNPKSFDFNKDLPPIDEQSSPPTTPLHFAEDMERQVIEDTERFFPEYDSQSYRFTDEVLKDLAICLVKDHSKKFSCLKAGITIKEFDIVVSNNPSLAEFFDQLREIPNAIAQEGIIQDIKHNRKTRQWYAETRMSDKYSKKHEVEHTVQMGNILDRMEETDKGVIDGELIN